MNKAQEKAINLLKEMKEICDANKIPFFLIGSYALRAFRSGSFESDACNLEVGMLYKDVIKFKNVENQHPNIIIIKELQRIIKYLLNLKQLFLKNFIGTMYLPIRIKEFMDMKSKVTYRLEGYYLISNSNLPDNKIAVDKYGKQKVKYLKINK